MNQVMIDFSGYKKAVSLQSVFIFFAAVLTCATAIWEYYANSMEMKVVAQQEENARFSLERVKFSETLPTETISIPEIEAINHAVSQMNLPWGDLFGIFEAHPNKGVALIALEPNGQKQLLSIVAEARKPEDMADYLGMLASDKFFTQVTLTRHEINEQDPNRPIRFTLEACWTAGI